MATELKLLNANFGASLSVLGCMTTRSGGVSRGVYGQLDGNNGLNLGANCGDAADAVSANRASLQARIGHPVSWMNQVHGTHVHVVNPSDHDTFGADSPVVADAMITTAPNCALGVLTADCLPVLFASDSAVGVAHAGWRGLSAGVLETTMAALNQSGTTSENVHVWLGAAIGPTAFEVGDDVVQAFSGVSGDFDIGILTQSGEDGGQRRRPR